MPEPVKPGTTDRILRAITELTDRINADPFGRLHIEWQDGRPVLVEVTTKHKPKV